MDIMEDWQNQKIINDMYDNNFCGFGEYEDEDDRYDDEDDYDFYEDD